MNDQPSKPELDHLGIAVPDLEQGLALWRDTLGLELTGIEEVPSEGVRVAVLQIGGTRIELLEPLNDESPVAKHLEKRGAGIHHVAVKVPDLEAAQQRLRDAGKPPLRDEARPGAGGARVNFLHPKHAGGVLLELTTGHGSHGD